MMKPIIMAAALLTLSAGQALAEDAKHGADVFSANCSVCHSVSAKQKDMTGPSLYGVIGRKAGTRPGYSYSSAMVSFGQVWTPELLTTYLAGPQKMLPGIKMGFAGLTKPGDIADVIAFLRQQKPAG